MTCQWHIGAFAQGSSVFVWQWRCWWQAESKLTQHVSFAVGIYWKDVLGRFRLTCQRYTVLSVLLLFNWAVNRSYWTKQTTNTPPIPVCPPPRKKNNHQPTNPTDHQNQQNGNFCSSFYIQGVKPTRALLTCYEQLWKKGCFSSPLISNLAAQTEKLTVEF